MEPPIGPRRERRDPPTTRVLYVLRRFPSLTHTFIEREIAGLQAVGVEVVVAALRDGGDDDDRAVDVPAVPTISVSARCRDRRWMLRRAAPLLLRRPWILVRALRGSGTTRDDGSALGRFARTVAVAAIARELRTQHVHSHFLGYASDVATDAARLAGLGVTATAHAVDVFRADRRRHVRRRADRLDGVVTVSAFNVDHLRSVTTRTPVTHVPNGLTTPREVTPVDLDGPVVSIGRLVPKKGMDTVLRAAASLRDVTVEIVGDGPDAAVLDDLRTELGLETTVHLLGALDRRTTQAHLQACSIFVLACRIASDGDQDGMPTVIIEAMAQGRPVVATDVGGIGEVVIDGETGLLVPPDDPDALAAAIRRLQEDPGLAELLARNGRAFVQEHFDPERAARRLCAAMGIGPTGRWRVVVLNTVVANGGDAAILEAELGLLRSALDGEVEVTVVDSLPELAPRRVPGPRFIAEAGTRSGALRSWRRGPLRDLPSLRTLVLAAAWGRRDGGLARRLAPVADREVLDALAGAHLVVATGGTMMVERYRLRHRLTQLTAAVLLHRPIVLATQTLGPFSRPVNRVVLRFLLRRTARVLVRSEEDRRHLLDLDARLANIEVTADVVFSLVDDDATARTTESGTGPGAPRVVLSLREWKHFADGGRDPMAAYLTAVGELCTHLVRERGATITCVSTCQGIPEYSYDDAAVADRLVSMLDDDVRAAVSVDSGLHTTEELRAILSTQDLVVGTRLHLCILALTTGVPALPIAYESKTNAVYARLLPGCEVLDIETVTGPDLIAAAETWLTDRSLREKVVSAVIDERDRSRTSMLHAIEVALPAEGR